MANQTYPLDDAIELIDRGHADGLMDVGPPPVSSDKCPSGLDKCADFNCAVCNPDDEGPEPCSTGDDFDTESAKALAFVEAPGSPSKKETSRLAETLLDACDTIDSLREKNAKLHSQVLDYENREASCCPEDTPFEAVIEKLRAEVERLENAQTVIYEGIDRAERANLQVHLDREKKLTTDLREKLAAAGWRIENAQTVIYEGIDRAEKAERERDEARAADGPCIWDDCDQTAIYCEGHAVEFADFRDGVGHSPAELRKERDELKARLESKNPLPGSR